MAKGRKRHTVRASSAINVVAVANTGAMSTAEAHSGATQTRRQRIRIVQRNGRTEVYEHVEE